MKRFLTVICASTLLLPAAGWAVEQGAIADQWLPSMARVARGPEDLAIGDFNGDSLLDVATSGWDGVVSLLLGKADASLMRAAGSPFPIGTTFIRSIAAADFDGDGNLDVAGVNTVGGAIVVLRGDGAGALSPAPGSPFTAGAWSWHMTVEDFNHDNYPDIAIADSGNYKTLVALNDGSGSFPVSLQSIYPAGANPVDILTVDLDNDDYSDLITANYNANTLTVLRNDGAGHFTQVPGSPIPSGGFRPEYLVAADFNEDGNSDVACVHYSSSSVTIFLGDGTGNLALSGSPISNILAWRGTSSDIDGDGHQDLVVVGPSNSQAPSEFKLLRGDGTGSFQIVPLDTNLLASNAYSVRVIDLDRNGHDEIVVTSVTPSDPGLVTVLRNERIFGENFD